MMQLYIQLPVIDVSVPLVVEGNNFKEEEVHLFRVQTGDSYLQSREHSSETKQAMISLQRMAGFIQEMTLDKGCNFSQGKLEKEFYLEVS